MRKNVEKFIGLLTMAIFAVLGIADASGAVLGAEGVVTTDNGAHVNNEPIQTDVTKENSPELLRPTIDDIVTKIEPESHLLEIVTRTGARKVKAKSMVFQWYSVDTPPVKDTVGSGGVSAVTTNLTATLPVSTSELFDVSDTILVKGVKGYDAQGNVTTKDLVLYVNAVGTGSLTVTAINGGKGTGTNKTYVPAIAEGTVIYRLSRAAAEGEMRTPSYGVLPKKSENYCQIFMAEIAQSTLQKIAEKEVDWEFSDEEEMAVKKMLREMESSFLFGVKEITYDNVKKANVYSTEGIYNQIDKVIEYVEGETPKDSDIIDWAKTIFSGTNGSNKRLMFMGSEFNAILSKNTSIQRQLDAGNTVVAFGLEWKEIRTNFGSILAIQYNTLDRYGRSEEAIVIDPNNLVKAELKSLSSVLLDLRKPGLYDGDAKVFQEISCLNIKNPKCHAIIRTAASVITIGTQPQNASVTEGSITGSLSVAATANGNATVAYQWYSAASAAAAGTAIDGATDSSFTIPTDLTDGTYYYYVVVSATNIAGTSTKKSNVATVTVSD